MTSPAFQREGLGLEYVILTKNNFLIPGKSLFLELVMITNKAYRYFYFYVYFYFTSGPGLLLLRNK
jgi:hypothetical protein